jgi:hypothetical protein
LEHVDPPLGLHRERLAGELVDDVEQLHRPAVLGHVGLEVERPHVIGPLGPQPIARYGRLPDTLALATLLRNPKSLLAPQPLCALAVQPPAPIEQILVRPAVPPPRPLAGEPPQLRTQRRVLRRDERLVTLRRAMLTHDPARPPLRQAETILEHQDRPAPARRAHQFPRLTSFSAAMFNA